MCAVLVVGVVGCGGPNYLSGSVSDWYQQQYHDSPWIFGNILSYGLYGMVWGFTVFADAIALNTYHFWFKDAQPAGDGKGSTYDHKNPTPGKKTELQK